MFPILTVIPRMLKKEKGFTIIELLVVIAIIAVLASITMSGVGTLRRKAKLARANTEFSQIEKAMKIFAAEHGLWPGEEQGFASFYGETPYSDIGGDNYYLSAILNWIGQTLPIFATIVIIYTIYGTMIMTERPGVLL